MTNPTPYRVEGFGEELDVLIRSHEGRQRDFSEYDTGLDGFLRFWQRELKARLPWKNPANPERSQHHLAEALFTYPQVAAITANATGKDHLAAAYMLHWVHVRRGKVVLVSAGEAQVTSISMGAVARLWRPDLGSDLFKLSLRTDDPDVGIEARAASTTSRLTGYHGRVLAVISEAQGVGEDVWNAALSWHPQQILALGNPMAASGRLYQISRPGSGWYVVNISALDHPNFTGAEDRIEGGPTAEGCERIAQMSGGTSSPEYVARVLGQFPDHVEGGLVPRSWCDRASELGGTLAPHDPRDDEPVVGVDFALAGGDRTVGTVLIPRGDGFLVTEQFTVPPTSDSEILVDRLAQMLADRGVTPREKRVNPSRLNVYGTASGPRDSWGDASNYVYTGGWGTLCVDANSLGEGPSANLKTRRHFNVMLFKGSQRALHARRFERQRTESHFLVRELLEANRLAFAPPMGRWERLFDQLTGVKYKLLPTGLLQIELKDDTKARLGHSPDELDSLCLAVWGAMRPGSAPRQTAVQW